MISILMSLSDFKFLAVVGVEVKKEMTDGVMNSLFGVLFCPRSSLVKGASHAKAMPHTLGLFVLFISHSATGTGCQ